MSRVFCIIIIYDPFAIMIIVIIQKNLYPKVYFLIFNYKRSVYPKIANVLFEFQSFLDTFQVAYSHRSRLNELSNLIMKILIQVIIMC